MKILKPIIGLVIVLFASFCFTACSDEDDTFFIYNQNEQVNQELAVAGNVNSIELKFNHSISDITDIVVDDNAASTNWADDELVISFPQNNTDKEIVIPVKIAWGNHVKTFNIIQKVKTKVQSAQAYYTLSPKGGKESIEINLTTASKFRCEVVHDGEMFASIQDLKQEGKLITIELNITTNTGAGRACGLRIIPEDGDDAIIGLWQQPREFTDNETFDVSKSGSLGVMLGENADNYAHLKNVTISGSLNANDMAVIKKLFNKYTYNGLARPQINLDLNWTNISDSSNQGYYEKFGGIGSITGDNQVPTPLNTIPSEVFQQSDNLISIILPSSVTDIERAAFRECPNLESVSLPIDCKRIGAYTFFNCSKLTHIKSLYNIDYCRITSIGDYAFSGIGQLDYLFLPDELTNFTSNSLLGFKVNTLYMLKQTPPDIHIYGISEGCTLLVPKGCIDVYRNSDEWGKFTEIKEITSEYNG